MPRSTRPPRELPERPPTRPPPPFEKRKTRKLEQVELVKLLAGQSCEGGCAIAMYAVRSIEEFRKRLHAQAREIAELKAEVKAHRGDS